MTGSNESSPGNGKGGGSTEDKGHSFRKRKLSLTNLREAGNAKRATPPSPRQNETFDLQALQAKQDTAVDLQNLKQQTSFSQSTADDDDDDDEKAHSFRKRRLSLTRKREDSSHEEREPIRRRRRHSDASGSSFDSAGVSTAGSQSSTKRQQLKSRIVHAPELLSHPPPSPMASSDNRLYQQSTRPPQQPLVDAIGEGAAPKWKKRHTRHLHEDERKLPFPRDIVGTFSCHGIEPVYDDEYVKEDEDDGHDKPTTAAKINQDRGGVAFPYGNCARTALFAVYDGEFKLYHLKVN
jgi:hypothetical protein